MPKYSMEIQDQINYFALKIGSQMLHCVLFFEDHLDDVLLKKAIAHSMEIEKILDCQLIRQDNLVFWEKQANLKRSKQFEIIETTEVQNELENFWVQEIDLEKDPLLQVKVFRNDKDCLCIKISHVISDAGGLKNYVSSLAKLYTDLVNGTEILAKYPSIADRSQNQIFQSLNPSISTKLQEKSMNFFRSVQPNWSFPSKGYQKSKFRFNIVRIGNELYHAIIKTSKEKNITLNDMILTAFCCALRKEEEYPLDQPMIVQVPVDLRRYLDKKNTFSICNMSGTEYLNIMIKNNNFMDVLEKVHEYMQSIKSNYPGLASAFAMEFLASTDFEQAMSISHGAMEKSKQYNVSIPILTNMGNITDNCKKFGHLVANDGYLVSPLMYSPGFMLGVSSFGDTLTLTVGFSEESIEIEHMQKFMKQIIFEMEEACVL